MQDWIAGVFTILERWAPLGVVEFEGARLIGHVPHIAPLAYLHRIPAPMSDADIVQAEQLTHAHFPVDVATFFRHTNGLLVFSGALGVYGIRKSYQRSDMLAASALPFDIGLPNSYERPRGLAVGAFVIGSYGWDGSEVCIDEGGGAFICDRRDASNIKASWPNFRTWLTDEVDRLAALFDQNGIARNENARLPPFQ